MTLPSCEQKNKMQMNTSYSSNILHPLMKLQDKPASSKPKIPKGISETKPNAFKFL